VSIDTAISRIGQILAAEQQLRDGVTPSAATTSTQSVSPTSSTGGASSTFGQALAGAQASLGTAASTTSGYVNPLANAQVCPERIDQGVDYAGTGSLGAIGAGVVTQVVQTGSGWEGGGYVEYRLTSGPYAGRSVYYAEGVTPTVQVGETLAPGQQVATLIPGASTGIEIGFAAGQGQASYANIYGGGYSEGDLTAAGQAFSQLIASLGGPAGLTEGRSVTGHFP
jgi:hypothetical protein